MNKKKEAETVFKELLNQVNPVKLIPHLVSLNHHSGMISVLGQEFKFNKQHPIFVIGTGKASASMAVAMESILIDKLKAGLIISSPAPLHQPKNIKTTIGSHPYPDIHTLDASNKLIQFIEKIPKGALVINLVSGGTSSLFCKPAGEISINQLSMVYKLLVKSGASINEINTVRKSISEIKGGQLLSKLSHTHLIDLIISDVPDDNPKDIGSGPTIPQSNSVKLSKQILNKYDIWNPLPAEVKTHIDQLAKDEAKNGPIVVDDIQNHQTFIITSASIVAKKAEELWKEKGYDTDLENDVWTGSIEEFEKYILKKASTDISIKASSKVHIFYGECTVNISGTGKGGRNQELALRIAKTLRSSESKIIFLSAGTDGIDGPTDVAGAVVDQTTWSDASAKGIDPAPYLKNNDSYSFFRKAGGHIKTGPTGNNVMDLQFLILE